MLQQIEEACPMGAHAALIVPPTWIIRVKRHQVTLFLVLPSCFNYEVILLSAVIQAAISQISGFMLLQVL